MKKKNENEIEDAVIIVLIQIATKNENLEDVRFKNIKIITKKMMNKF